MEKNYYRQIVFWPPQPRTQLRMNNRFIFIKVVWYSNHDVQGRKNINDQRNCAFSNCHFLFKNFLMKTVLQNWSWIMLCLRKQFELLQQVVNYCLCDCHQRLTGTDFKLNLEFCEIFVTNFVIKIFLFLLKHAF